MRIRPALALLPLLASALTGLLPAAPAGADDPTSYRTVLIGRAMDGLCTARTGAVIPDALSLTEVAQALAARGMTATVNVVLSRMPDSGPDVCLNGRLYPSRETVAGLVSDYGWSVNSAGFSHTIVTTEDDSQVAQDACGSRDQLTADGLPTPAEFAYPDGKYTARAQSVIRTCPYSFGRYYQVGAYATQASAAASDGAVPTMSVNGRTPHYQSARVVQRALTPPVGGWAQVQIYHLIRDGAYRAPGSTIGSWDCRSGVPHATSRAEFYCASDFFAALDASIAASPSTANADPAQMAVLWDQPAG